MSDDDENGDGEYQMHGSLGDLELKVTGPESDWVEEQFEQSWQNRLKEAQQMKEALRSADRSTQ